MHTCLLFELVPAVDSRFLQSNNELVALLLERSAFNVVQKGTQVKAELLLVRQNTELHAVGTRDLFVQRSTSRDMSARHTTMSW